MYPPAGGPHQGPQPNPPHHHGYPQHLPPRYPIEPMPPPPWQDPSIAPPQKPKGRARYLPIVVSALFGALLVTVAMVMLRGDTGGYFDSGDRVTPTADGHMVFAKEKHLDGKPPSSVRCTAITDAGEELTLPAPDEVKTTSRGARPTIRYVSVAELPNDRGPLAVTCIRVGSDFSPELVLGKPESSTSVLVFFAGYGALMVVLIGVVIVANRRYMNRYPAPQGDGQQWQV
ncbi:hypothetical protein [Mycobacterium sp. DL99]|uniref:hypothetical protein n=1 Tax=Mycobacterium sp. DL99 TaxID=2528957 RepID=UPI001080B96E|nr:hypothetical protein [Mycobacterium sp. DL99]